MPFQQGSVHLSSAKCSRTFLARTSGLEALSQMASLPLHPQKQMHISCWAWQQTACSACVSCSLLTQKHSLSSTKPADVVSMTAAQHRLHCTWQCRQELPCVLRLRLYLDSAVHALCIAVPCAPSSGATRFSPHCCAVRAHVTHSTAALTGLHPALSCKPQCNSWRLIFP